MSTIHIKHNHSLSHEQTRERVEQIASHLKGKYRGAYAWQGDSLHFRRSGVSGYVKLGAGYVELQINLGLMLGARKSEIEAFIRRHIPTAMGEYAG